MTIAVGDKLPDLKLKERTPDGPVDISTDDLFKGRRVVLFAVPGAFTPTCSLNHLPGYLENRDAILARGVDDIAVVAVNDHHVMGAWATSTVARRPLRWSRASTTGTSDARTPAQREARPSPSRLCSMDPMVLDSVVTTPKRCPSSSMS